MCICKTENGQGSLYGPLLSSKCQITMWKPKKLQKWLLVSNCSQLRAKIYAISVDAGRSQVRQALIAAPWRHVNLKKYYGSRI